jgi:signal transduction histidine kinase
MISRMIILNFYWYADTIFNNNSTMIESKITRLIKQSIPLLVAILSFSILLTGSFIFSNYRKAIWEKDAKTRLYEILMTKKTKLEKGLHSRINNTRCVAAYVSLNPNISNNEFYNLAEELINNDSVIGTMSIARNCIINGIYPLEGHEAALGLNLLSHPERKEIVEKTIETHSTFIAGPVELIEGGMAFISYTPVFDKNKTGDNKFWGVTDIVFNQDMLLDEAELKESELGFSFAIKGYNGQGDDETIWWGNPDVFDKQPISIVVDLPHGSWILAATPEIGWPAYIDKNKIIITLLIMSSSIISLLIWLFSRIMVKIIKSEQELKILNSTKDKVFSIIAHDLRTPFNSILGLADLLNSNYTELNEEERQDYISNIYMASKSAYELLENLLLWSTNQQNKIEILKENINLKKIVNEAIAVYMPGLEQKNITLDIRIPETITVNADKFAIKTIIGNLFNNAIKFTKSEGYIKIDAHHQDKFTEISISDNGVGIPEEDIPKLFRIEDNITTMGTKNEKGTGLGLLICKEFIENHKGEIWVESKLGVGSTFYFTIPNDAVDINN